VPNILALF